MKMTKAALEEFRRDIEADRLINRVAVDLMESVKAPVNANPKLKRRITLTEQEVAVVRIALEEQVVRTGKRLGRCDWDSWMSQVEVSD